MLLLPVGIGLLRQFESFANQIDFVNLVVNHLTEFGVMTASRLYESPFTDKTPHGPDAIFSSSQVDELLDALGAVNATAIAA